MSRAVKEFRSVRRRGGGMVAAALASSKRTSRTFAAAVLLWLALLGSAAAQQSPPLSFVIGPAQGAGTVSSTDQQYLAVGGASLRCTFNQSAHTGTPSTTFTIQGKDPSGQYYALLTSGAITADATATPLVVGLGVSAAANASIGLPVPEIWRVSATVGGTTPAVTATVNCRVQ